MRPSALQKSLPPAQQAEVSTRDPSQFAEDNVGSQLVEELAPEAFKNKVGKTGMDLTKRAANAVEETGKTLFTGADREERHVVRQKEEKRKSMRYKAEMKQVAQAEELQNGVFDVNAEQAATQLKDQQFRLMEQRAAQDIAHKERESALNKRWGDQQRQVLRHEVEEDLKLAEHEDNLNRHADHESKRLAMSGVLIDKHFALEQRRHEADLNLIEKVHSDEMKEYETMRETQMKKVVALKFSLTNEQIHKEEQEHTQAQLRAKLHALQMQEDNQVIAGQTMVKEAELEVAKEVATIDVEHAKWFKLREAKDRQRALEEEKLADTQSHEQNHKDQLALSAELSKITSGLNICASSVLHQASIVNKRGSLETQVENCLGINKESNDMMESVKKKLQTAKVLFLSVILGCELDLFGFCLAYFTYQKAGMEFVPASVIVSAGGVQKVVFNASSHTNHTVQMHPDEHYVISWLLFIGPAGYMLATTMYILWTSGCVTLSLRQLGEQLKENCELDIDFVKVSGTADLRQQFIHEDSALQVQIRLEEGMKTNDGTPLTALKYNEFQLGLSREQITLRFYHFLPVFRYYLLVKDAESADVECLFRVNGLSTFTLGFAQIFCMIIGITTGILQFDFFIKFGIFAQVVNILMTGVYFFTDYPETMKSSMSVEAFQYNARLAMQGEFTRYKQTADQYAINFGSHIPSMDLGEFLHSEETRAGSSAKPWTTEQEKLLKELQHFRFRVLRDINEISHLQINLSPFPTQKLFEWRAKMVSHQVVKYGELAGI